MIGSLKLRLRWISDRLLRLSDTGQKVRSEYSSSQGQLQNIVRTLGSRPHILPLAAATVNVFAFVPTITPSSGTTPAASRRGFASLVGPMTLQ
jgi:hypothetical protein